MKESQRLFGGSEKVNRKCRILRVFRVEENGDIMEENHGEQIAKDRELNIKINSIKFCRLTSATKCVLLASLVKKWLKNLLLGKISWKIYLIRDIWCISYSVFAVLKQMFKSNINGQIVYFGSQDQVVACQGWKEWCQEWATNNHTDATVRKQRLVDAGAQFSASFLFSQDPQSMIHFFFPAYKVQLSTSIQTLLDRHGQRLI